MANINWYPGHMTKSIRMIEENIRLIDCLVYVLDARAPRSCINPDFERYILRLPVVYVLNKADLADPAQTEKWKRKLTGERSVAVVTNASASKSCAVIVTEIRRLCSEKISRYAAKGVKTSVKAMVLGVPNTGQIDDNKQSYRQGESDYRQQSGRYPRKTMVQSKRYGRSPRYSRYALSQAFRSDRRAPSCLSRQHQRRSG